MCPVPLQVLGLYTLILCLSAHVGILAIKGEYSFGWSFPLSGGADLLAGTVSGCSAPVGFWDLPEECPVDRPGWGLQDPLPVRIAVSWTKLSPELRGAPWCLLSSPASL